MSFAKNKVERLWASVFVLLLGLVCSNAAQSAEPIIIPAQPQLAASAFLLIDADSGKTIVEHNSRQRLPPASLTKIMTSYIACWQL